MSCILSLLAQPQLRGLFPGGEVTSDGKLSFKTEDFGCCQLTGLRFGTNGCRQCEIRTRIERIEQILAHFKCTWPETPFPRPLEAKNGDFILDWLFSFRAGKVTSGYLIKKQTQGPSPFWWIAIAAIWRFGMEGFIIQLNAKQTADSLIKAYPHATEQPTIVFLEQVRDVRDVEVGFFFDAVVNWCDAACVPLWIETLAADDGQVVKPGQSMLQQSFNRKIAGIERKRSPLAWLGADTRSRLTHICRIPKA